MTKAKVIGTPQEVGQRYGIGEWYGRPFAVLSADERKQLAFKSLGGKLSGLPCPFMSTPDQVVPCNKRGGVCTMRLYKLDARTDKGSPIGPFVTMCPSRFEEGKKVYSWIGSILLGTDSPLLMGQVGFLKRPTAEKGHQRQP